MIAPTTTSSVVMGTTMPPWSAHVPDVVARQVVRGEDLRAGRSRWPACMAASASAQCGGVDAFGRQDPEGVGDGDAGGADQLTEVGDRPLAPSPG